METSELSASERWARLRFAVVGPLFEAPPQAGELQDALHDLAQRHWRHPTQSGKRVRFGRSTIERWFYAAKKAANPMDVLRRKVRSDAGVHRVCDDNVIDYLQEQYSLYPTWSYWLHHGNIVAYLAQKPELGPAPSYPTLRRLMHERGWRKIRRRRRQNPTAGQQAAEERLRTHEVRSYEAVASHAAWHLDFHDGSLRVAGKDGVLRTPQCLAILDDHSRLCCHIQWYMAEDTEVLVHGVAQAMMKRGLPRCILSDNGAAMIAGEYETGLASLGVGYRTTLPHSPHQNGKQEKFWESLEGRCVAMLERVRPLTLEFLNRATQAWVERDYNRGVHEEIKMTPLQRLVESPNQGRSCPPLATLQRAFCVVAKRMQRRSDGTLSIDGVRFELPNQLRTLAQVTLRYRRWDLSEAYVVDPRNTMNVVHRITPLDKSRNADGRRRTTLADVHARIVAYVGQHYHEVAHASLMGRSPAAVWATRKTLDTSEEQMRNALVVRAKRRVNGDNTLNIGGVVWETEQGFLAGLKVTVARTLLDMNEPPWIEHEDRKSPLHIANPTANARQRRQPETARKQSGIDVLFDPTGVLMAAQKQGEQ